MPNFPGAAGGTTPVLSNASPIVLAKPGDSCFLFGVLAATATQLPVTDANVATENLAGASIAVGLPQQEEGGPPAVSVEVICAAAPGSGESIVVQEADTHADGCFIMPNNAAYTINSFNTYNVARADLSPTGGKYLRVSRTKGANAVALTVKVTRLG
jgi:hypothetical protein